MCDVDSAQLFTSAGTNFHVVLLSMACRQAELDNTKAWMLAFLTMILEPFAFLTMGLEPFTPGHFPVGSAFLLNTVLSCYRISALTSAQQ